MRIPPVLPNFFLRFYHLFFLEYNLQQKIFSFAGNASNYILAIYFFHIIIQSYYGSAVCV